MTPDARCPECSIVKRTELRAGRLVFIPHGSGAGRRAKIPCPGSRWLVEDDEVVR